jgi:hypothetical protein
MGRPFLQSDNPLYRFRVEYIAANAIPGIGRVTDHRSLIDLFDHPADKPELGIVWIDLNYHERLSVGECPAEDTRVKRDRSVGSKTLEFFPLAI